MSFSMTFSHMSVMYFAHTPPNLPLVTPAPPAGPLPLYR